MNDDVRRRLEQDLGSAVSRLRQAGGALAVEDLAGLVEALHSAFIVNGDVVQANESLELSFAMRGLLLERAHRLSAALDRLDRGEYGTCAECGEPIAAARLRALPEVQTCVGCQAPAGAR